MGFVSKMPLRRHPACASTPGASRPTRPSPGEVRRLLLGGHRSPCGSVGASRRAIGPGVRASLEARGHTLRDGRAQMGGYQAVMIDPETGVLLGGSDPRKDGLAIGC